MVNKITNRQMFFILCVTLTSFSVIDIARALTASAGYGSWLTILIATLFFMCIAIIVTTLQKNNEGLTLFQYSENLVGKVGKYILVIYYILYFIMINVFLNIKLSSILKADFIQKTPLVGTLAIGIPIFCFIAYKGMTSVARLFELVGIVYIIVGMTVHIFMITQGHAGYLLPLFNKEDFGIYLSALKEAIFPFLGIEVLLHIPFCKENGKKSVTTSAFSIFFIGLFYILIIDSCIMILGMNNIVHYNSSLIVAIRAMELPFLVFLKRMDVLFLTAGFAAFVLGITVLITILIDILSSLFTWARRSSITISLGGLIFLLCLIFQTSIGYSEFVTSAGIYLGLVASFIIPSVLLIINMVKAKGTKNAI